MWRRFAGCLVWTTGNRARTERDRQHDPSDPTDQDGAPIARQIPPAKPGGCKREVTVRDIANGVRPVLSTGRQWRSVPRDLPAKSTVHDDLDRRTCDGALAKIHHALYVECREAGDGMPVRQPV